MYVNRTDSGIVRCARREMPTDRRVLRPSRGTATVEGIWCAGRGFLVTEILSRVNFFGADSPAGCGGTPPCHEG